MKYLNIVYKSDINNDELMKLHGFFNFDFAGNLYQYKSYFKSVFKLAKRVVLAVSKRQSVVIQFNTEAEYYSGVKAGQESEYLHQVLNEMGYKGKDA
jgi:hypothetical protein